MPRSDDYRKYLESQFSQVHEKLDDIQDNVKKINSRVDKLEGWKDVFEGGRKAKQAILTTIWTIAVIASCLIAIMSFVKGTNNVRELQVIENKLRDKQDKEPDSTVRAGGFGFPPITKDTAYINRCEREYKRLME